MSLENLRADPGNACLRNVYRTGPALNSFTINNANLQEGGRCQITGSKFGNGFFDLKAGETNSGTDYFYPWLQRGVGWVAVPKNAPDGTIVMTGGVNGCSIVVSEQGANYYFYHDGDSKHLKPNAVRGEQVAKVQPKDYDPLGWGNKTFTQALQEASQKNIKPKGDVSYGHFVIAVKKNGRFGLYSMGMMSVNGLKKLPNGVAPCIVSFGD